MADSQTGASTVTPSYRRNGKLFSCEPCRKGKLRCDHGTPICGRCARRNKSEQCIYHPAPLTKTRSSPSAIGPQRTSLPPFDSRNGAFPYPNFLQSKPGPVSPPSSAGAPSRDPGAPRHMINTTFNANSAAQSPGPGAPTPSEEQRTSTSSYRSPENMSFREPRPGFLGPTSYSAVYTENCIAPDPSADMEDDSSLPPVSAEKIQQGAEVLALLRDMHVFRRFTQRLFDLNDGIVVMQPVFKIWLDELWSEFGPLLTESRPESLIALSELVWRNTRRPFNANAGMTAETWARASTGKNLRWEIVGIILSLVGLIASSLSRWDTIFDSMKEYCSDRALFADKMRKASEFCQCFCYEAEVLNDMYVCFMYEDLILVECLKGDAHYAVWQRTGEICDAIVAMGIHQGNAVNSDTPFFLAELRKRIFCSVYGRDKVLATFLGRPPRLSHRYCKMEMPLDLSDDQLFSAGPEQDAIVASLDSNGWNTSGELTRTTWGRVWFQHCRIREDILEIALGTGDEDIMYRATKVRNKLNALHASFPGFMKLSPEVLLDFDTEPSEQALCFGAGAGVGNQSLQVNAIFTICVHAGILNTEFLLQRALVNRAKTDTAQLIPVSRRLLAIVLLAMSKKDFFRDFQADMVYLLAVHGLPSAGVLAIELLRQEQSPNYNAELLPRSQTIQDLSVFISALATVGPGEGNHGICDQGRRSLKRVLDQILSPTARPLQPATAANADQPVFDDMSLYFPTGNDADFLQWLENVEWDKGGWLPGANQHQLQPETIA